MSSRPGIPSADQFDPLTDEQAARWSRFANWDEVNFITHLGMEVEEIRSDYARIRLPYRTELRNKEGFVHGGVLASLLDTVNIPAVSASQPRGTFILTITMNVQYLGAVADQDVIAEGWVTKRGRSVAFCESAASSVDGELVATAQTVFRVQPPRDSQRPSG